MNARERELERRQRGGIAMVRTKILAGVALWAVIGSSSAQAVDDAVRSTVAGNGGRSCAE